MLLGGQSTPWTQGSSLLFARFCLQIAIINEGVWKDTDVPFCSQRLRVIWYRMQSRHQNTWRLSRSSSCAIKFEDHWARLASICREGNPGLVLGGWSSWRSQSQRKGTRQEDRAQSCKCFLCKDRHHVAGTWPWYPEQGQDSFSEGLGSLILKDLRFQVGMRTQEHHTGSGYQAWSIKLGGCLPGMR